MILLIDNYDSFTYNLYQAFCMLQEKVIVVRNDRISVPEIEKMNLKGIVLSPGPGRPEDAGICIEVIQKLGSKIPILGVCLGHQAIGVAFGGKVIRAKEILHGKDSLIFHFRGTLFEGVFLPFKAGRYHSLIVDQEALPKELKVEAEDPEGNIMALSHETFPIFGVQFHPESIMTAEGPKIIKNYIDFCASFTNQEKVHVD
jgi:anthranilate synthase component II